MSSSFHLTQLRKWLLSSPPVEWAIQQTRELLLGALRQGPIPQHIAFVMDGNRRFARQHHIETVEGHNMGFEALARILEVCYKSGVKVVTIYAFSIENFQRSQYEVDHLMEIAKIKLAQMAQHGDLMERYGACIRIIGRRDLLREDVRVELDRAVALTEKNNRAILNVCFPYTSRDEITTAVRETVVDYLKPVPPRRRPFSETHIARNIRARHINSIQESREMLRETESSVEADTSDSMSSSTTLNPGSSVSAGQPEDATTTDTSIDGNNDLALGLPDVEAITPAMLEKHMFTHDTPPLELLIRTSGVERLSDFMLWQCHEHTKVCFLECLWPEFDLWHFLPVLWEWQREQRRRVLGSWGTRSHLMAPVKV
ncbi:MAG: cis-prenyltransferase [Bathelium mastoideum]|nr:MAG: cis-prenyltransferase [Bathelium mastoideum]